MQMKLKSTYEDLATYVRAQMHAIDRAIKEGQPSTLVTAAMKEIAECNKLVNERCGNKTFQIEVATTKEEEENLTAWFAANDAGNEKERKRLDAAIEARLSRLAEAAA